MNLERLLKPDLLLMCGELGIDTRKIQRKPFLLKAIQDIGAEDAELEECWELIKARKREAEEQEQRVRREAEEREQRAREEREGRERHELEMKRLDLELKRAENEQAGSRASNSNVVKALKIKELLQPFKTREDIGLFLVNFERTCDKMGFSRDTWPQHLLTLLPCEAADVVARLNTEDASDYEKVKLSLLKKYRLSTEAFRQRFRGDTKKTEQSFTEFAYSLRSNLVEWLKSAEVYGDHDRVVECMGLEQLYKCMPETVRFWVQDKLPETTQKAAELAEEYMSRRGSQKGDTPERRGLEGRADYRGRFSKTRSEVAKQDFKGPAKDSPREAGSTGSDRVKEVNGTPTEGKASDLNRKRFESRQPMRCFRCNETGHIAAGCRKPRMVFSYVSNDDENDKLLAPYTHDLRVNGHACKVLRDSAATLDVMHTSLVRPENYTGECAWIRQVVEQQSVCLPVAKVVIEGPFGTLETEAAVSNDLPLQYPYLFSNKSDQKLRDMGKQLTQGVVQALTRSKARELESQLVYDREPGGSPKTKKKGETPASVAEDEETRQPSETRNDSGDAGGSRESIQMESDDRVEDEFQEIGGHVVPPVTEKFRKLLRVDAVVLQAEQKADPSLETLSETEKDGVAKKNVTIFEKEGLLHRQYEDRRGRVFDQLIVPSKYRSDLLQVAHENPWSGHLGIKKTKERLLQEYYWPGCFRDVENHVKSCSVCQIAGKPSDKWKAPLRLVPLISEPFRRLVIDTVGPLPITESGYKYILTMICPATKFPEAVPLKGLTSAEIVDALLTVFARVGFPAELQSDQGSVFTSALTTTFLERCGIKIIHSSLHHPQTNSVERWHAVLKRVLRALTHEHKRDWEGCLPAAMFALRSAAHESTGFSPAELVYGRALRSPLRMLRESWEGSGEDTTVVEYVLGLLERLHVAKKIAAENMSTSQLKAKAYYDRTARKRTFEVSDRVMLLRCSKKNKLEVHWEGPAKVIEKLSDTNYAVQLGGRRKEVKIYHSNLMKPFIEREGVALMSLNAPEEVHLPIPQLGEHSDATGIEDIMQKAVKTKEMTPEHLCDLRGLLEQFRDIFSNRPGRTTEVTHDIELTSDQPIKAKSYRQSPRQRDLMKTEIDRMLKLGVIEPGESDYTSPLIMVEVPGKDPRPCIDYRRLNAVTRDQTYPIPNIEERIEIVSSARYISTLDLVRGYWQVPLTARASRYAAFVSPFGTFRPLMLSFGLKNAPFCFSSLMDRVLQGLGEFALPYLDDIAVFSNSWEDHLAHLRAVFVRLREANLTVKAEKCQLGGAEVTYLGHVVGNGSRRPSDIKIEAVANYPRPKTKTDIRAFLGLTGYYQRYIQGYSELASPLTDALRKPQPKLVLWDDRKQAAFQALKDALMRQPVLASPDYNRPFVVQCDASDRGMGVVLCQRDSGGDERPVLYVSRKLSVREEAYSASEKECACLVWAAQKLSCYLAGTKFTFETDHCPLAWLHNMSPKKRTSFALEYCPATI